jgi:cytochrome c-type biogenesis protein CcmH/NrfF
MLKLRTSILFTILAGLCISQTSTQLLTPEIRRVGDRLACKCGACNNTVATCQMLECHYTHPARQKIATLQSGGMSDDKIVDTFVQESGLSALAAPPTEGFHLLGYLMPFLAIGLGLAAIGLYFRHFQKTATAAGPALSPQIDERYRQKIEKDMADLE